MYVLKRPIFKTVGNVRITQHWGALTEPFIQVTTINITYPECISALDNRHAKPKHHNTWSSATCLALQFASILSQKTAWFSENVFKNKMRVLIFSTTLVWNNYHSKKNTARDYRKCT